MCFGLRFVQHSGDGGLLRTVALIALWGEWVSLSSWALEEPFLSLLWPSGHTLHWLPKARGLVCSFLRWSLKAGVLPWGFNLVCSSGEALSFEFPSDGELTVLGLDLCRECVFFYLLWCRPSFIGPMDRSHSDHCRSFFLEEIVAYAAVDLVFPWYEVSWSCLHHHPEPELTILLFKSLDAAGLLFLDLYLLFLIIIGINSHNHLNTMVLELEETQKLSIQSDFHSFPNHSLHHFNNRKLQSAMLH